jgi:hypothetical protein
MYGDVQKGQDLLVTIQLLAKHLNSFTQGLRSMAGSLAQTGCYRYVLQFFKYAATALVMELVTTQNHVHRTL